MALQAILIRIGGIVQGVGFRPFVYGLAQRLALAGTVRNSSDGVEIALEGSADGIEAFLHALAAETPPLAWIDTLSVTPALPTGATRFTITPSRSHDGGLLPVSPDVAPCADCLRELADPADRRYRYPFINCTNCGPRFTIVTDLPYDRPKTTLAGFPLCPACQAEYDDPSNRRFHAQPVACPVCGPHFWLEIGGRPGEWGRGDAALAETQRLLAAGKIVAIKGVGGFHLACDATNEAAVARLRRRKARRDKPFAVMVADLAVAGRHARISPAESALLTSAAAPIVLLARRTDSPIAPAVAPDQPMLGLMLPSSPLHHLLFVAAAGEVPAPTALVMTSGNLSEEPLVATNAEARERLGEVADAWLLHNRPIHTRCDDSVLQLHAAPTFLRRARGYAPWPLLLPHPLPPLLATGALLKNSLCLTRERYAFVSQHIGDLENFGTLQLFERMIGRYEQLFRITPTALAHDLHPDAPATRYALARAARERLPAIAVQHHHAHIAAVMAEHRLPDAPVIGVAFDGTGYGSDGTIWGGEFLLCRYTQFERLAHLTPVPLAGGDQAAREPWRVALAWLLRAGLDPQPFLGAIAPERREVVARMMAAGVNSPLTSSMGRLFDGVAALLGVRQVATYEAQAAMGLEAAARGISADTLYPFHHTGAQIDPLPLIAALAADRQRGVAVGQLAARFHASVAEMVRERADGLRGKFGRLPIVLSGGVWQNATLLAETVRRLERSGHTVLLPIHLPANDGGLALGQAIIAGQSIMGHGSDAG